MTVPMKPVERLSGVFIGQRLNAPANKAFVAIGATLAQQE